MIKKLILFDKSYLVQAVYTRYYLLRRYGLKASFARNNLEPSHTGIPNQDDLPSTWSKYYKNKATGLAEEVIKKWRKEVESQGRNFVILYIPIILSFIRPLFNRLRQPWKNFANI